MRLLKFWKQRLPGDKPDEPAAQPKETVTKPDLDPADNGEIDEIRQRLKKIESDLSSSWALRPREEYEKRVLGGMKHEVNVYVAKIAAALFIFLGGAGFVLIEQLTRAVYYREAAAEYKNVVGRLEAELMEFKQRSKIAGEQQAAHNLGLLYRLVVETRFFDVQQNSGPAKGNRQQLVADLITRARRYFHNALEKDSKNSSTLWELGNLYSFIPAKEKLGHLVERDKAVGHFKKAVDGYPKNQINKGFRADTYQRIARIQIAECYEETDADAKEKLLAEIAECYRKAQTDYEDMPMQPDWVAEELNEIQSGLIEVENNNCPTAF